MSVIIKETLYVKPSRPTKHVQIPLSNCDITLPPYNTGFTYFFKNGFKKNNFMNIQKLLESLEDVLTDYYPLAGTLKGAPDGRSVIVCNDQGVQFIIAECSDVTINQLEEKNWEHAVIPYGLMPPVIPNNIDPILFLIQHTTFADGSVALGFAKHHQVMDGFGLFTFVENWGRRARLEQIDLPIHDRSLLKASGNPQTKVPLGYYVMDPTKNILSERQSFPLTTKIFHFGYDVLKRLRDYYSVGISEGNWISTNDALVAHFWRTTIRARNLDLNTEVVCSLALNGRDKLTIPKSYYGNVVFGVRLRMPVSQLINGSPSSVALQVRKAVTDMNESRIQSIIDWVEQQPDKSLVQALTEYDGKYLGGTNWTKFQKHDLIDFGDGTPIKQRCRREGEVDGLYRILGAEDGIEVYLGLQSEKLKILEQDPEFKNFIVPQHSLE